MTALEHVGKAALLAQRQGALLEHVVFAADRRGHVEHSAQLDEVLLRTLPLVEVVAQPARTPLV